MTTKRRIRKDHDPKTKLSIIFAKTKPNGDCLEWTGNFFKRYGSRNYGNDAQWGYPYMYYKNKVWRGNRLVMFLVHGHIPYGMQALHKCDNMKCINPNHLYFGTIAQNVKDTFARNRRHDLKRKSNGQFIKN